MFPQFSQTGVGVADRVQKRPSAFAHDKYLMYYEALVMEQTFHYCQVCPLLPMDALLMEASFFSLKDVSVKLLWKTSPFIFCFSLPSKKTLIPPPQTKKPSPFPKKTT